MTERLLASDSTGDRAMGTFVDTFFTMIPLDGSAASINGIVMLPVLVFGAETAAPMGATPVALIHTLWWAAARYLDDMIDDPQLARSDPADFNRGVMTAIAVGNYLPLRVFGDLTVSDAVRVRLITEYGNGCIAALSGQLTDLALNAETATPDDVLRNYESKTGAPYGMSAALAAHLADRDADRVEAWRSFGRALGVLRQLVNDQRDLVTERDEDLRNGTATYLLVHLLGSVSTARRAELIDLHRHAGTSEDARTELRRAMLAADVVSGYADSIQPIVRATREALASLGGDPQCVTDLSALIDETISHYPQFQLR
ncbi:polyprenyl synthetase family protein [Mycolicibacterium arenosum]|uniref:Polyprenyl synthetase family protein n=1 Tax=Mycolicibacterium arenosum TaxID=2952157 RepID=A0ABT1M4E2_9MYCO|nr:polyprenyl synthetase family protein [Mycolicibacterium sp. CAU 1645]MCP9274021.1 polyprenyl synthetase family protein [Mycolicibacterium sp. CAU 1645]